MLAWLRSVAIRICQRVSFRRKAAIELEIFKAWTATDRDFRGTLVT
jgi:hypothetical protein